MIKWYLRNLVVDFNKTELQFMCMLPVMEEITLPRLQTRCIWQCRSRKQNFHIENLSNQYNSYLGFNFQSRTKVVPTYTTNYVDGDSNSVPSLVHQCNKTRMLKGLHKLLALLWFYTVLWFIYGIVYYSSISSRARQTFSNLWRSYDKRF
jgi:hypothetical protein